MRRLWRQPVHKRDSQTQKDPVRTGEPGSGDRAPKNLELVAQGEILEGDGHRPEPQGAEERPETEHEEHEAPRHQT